MIFENGLVTHIHICPKGSEDMIGLSQANLVAGRGIEGDRYFLGTGTYSDKLDIRELTLIEQEVLDALNENQPPLQRGPIKLEPHEHRRNITTKNVPLNYLVGKRFRMGKAVIEGGRLNFPCAYLQELLGKPVHLPLYNRSGLNCRIIEGGEVHVGDPITLI